MAITVPVELHYEFAVKAPFKDVFALLSDVPKSASHFPKVAKLVDLGDNAYRWEMQKVGTAQVGIQTVYACQYSSDEAKGQVAWSPVKGEGNAEVSGSWRIKAGKGRTDIVFKTKAVLEVPLPALMKMVVVPVVESEFEGLVEKYIAKLCKVFGGEVED